jgi:hypothetical protein
MLSDSRPATPRPRPPAKARRLASQPPAPPPLPFLSPPPSYADSNLAQVDSSPLSSPVMTDFFAPKPFRPPTLIQPVPTRNNDWDDEKSREELGLLLQKAEQTIKDRENGGYLPFVADMC